MQAGAALYLFERGFKPHIVIGTSFGAINAVFIAADPTPKGIKRLLEFWNKVNEKLLFKRSLLDRLRGRKEFKLDNLMELLDRYLPTATHALEVPLLITTYDLNKEEIVVWQDHSYLPELVLASMAIPGIFQPVKLEDHIHVSGVVNLSGLYEAAIERNVTTIYAIESDNEKLLDRIDSKFRLYMKQNLILSKERNFPEKTFQRFRMESPIPFEDFSNHTQLWEWGYRQLRKQYVERRLLKLGRVKETLELLSRPDLTRDEEVLKAYALYMEGDLWKAFEEFDTLSQEEGIEENPIYIVGFSNLLIDMGSVEQAEKLLTEGKNRFPQNPYIYDTLSRITFHRGDVRGALEYLRTAIKLAREKHDPIAQNLSLNHMGITYYMMGDMKQALSMLEESANNMRILEHAYHTVVAYNNLIKVYNDTGQLMQAEHSVKMMEEYAILSGSSRAMAIYYSTYASTLAHTNLKEAIEIEKKGLRIAVEKNDLNMIPLFLVSIATKYTILGEAEKAEKYLREAMEISLDNNLAYPYQISVVQLAGVYILMGKKEEAEKVILEAQTMGRLAPIIQLQLEALRLYLYGQEDLRDYIRKLSEIPSVNSVLGPLPPPVKDFLYRYMEEEVDVETLIRMNLKDVIMKKLEKDPSARERFIEAITPEQSLQFIEIIKAFADKFRAEGFELKLRKITRFWQNNVKQYIKTFGQFTYFFNQEPVPQGALGDNMNRLILLFLITNEGKKLAIGNISSVFGIHSENVKERLEFIQQTLEPWVITESPKYLIIHEDEFIFNTDENFETDYRIFLENIALFEESGNYAYLERAIEVYHDDFLIDTRHYYFDRIRQNLKEKYMDAVLQLALHYTDEGETDRAIALLENFLLRYPDSEEHTKLLVKLLYREDKRSTAYEWYLRYVSATDKEPFDFYEVIKQEQEAGI